MTIYRIYEIGAIKHDLIAERSLTKALAKYLAHHPEIKTINDTIVQIEDWDDELDGVLRTRSEELH